MVRTIIAALVLGAGGAKLVEAQDDHGSLHPVWSPDGAWIAFESDRDGDFEVYVIRADGTGLRQLSRNRVADRMPAWSADGKSLRFMSDSLGQQHQWFEVPITGGTPRPFHPPLANPDSVQRADGKLVVYAASSGGGPPTPHGRAQAVFVKSGGTAPRRVSPPGHAEEPRLSPDGSWLVFEHRSPGDDLVDSRIFLVPTDGSAPARILTLGRPPHPVHGSAWRSVGDHDDGAGGHRSAVPHLCPIAVGPGTAAQVSAARSPNAAYTRCRSKLDSIVARARRNAGRLSPPASPRLAIPTRRVASSKSESMP